MSLESHIEELTQAICTLTDKIDVLTGVETPVKAEKTKKAEEPKEVEEKPAKKKKASKKKEEPKVEEKAEDIHDKAYYKETVQPMTRKAAKALGKDVVLGILDEFGTNVETAKDLEEGQWEDYVARLEAEIADKENDEDDLS